MIFGRVIFYFPYFPRPYKLKNFRLLSPLSLFHSDEKSMLKKIQLILKIVSKILTKSYMTFVRNRVNSENTLLYNYYYTLYKHCFLLSVNTTINNCPTEVTHCYQYQSSYMSAHPCSPMMSIALQNSPAEMYISAAALGSLLLLAQSACLVISIFLSRGSPDPMYS